MQRPGPRSTVGRLMGEVAFSAALLGPVAWAWRFSAVEVKPIAWMSAAGWAGMILLIRWSYRDFRNPFG